MPGQGEKETKEHSSRCSFCASVAFSKGQMTVLVKTRRFFAARRIATAFFFHSNSS